MKELRLKLVELQANLKAGKNSYNQFGGYKYRSAEGILEAVKPLMVGKGLFLTLTDDVKEVGGRVYVVATATIGDIEGNSISTSAMAREDESIKGMCGGQVTGACSSYARKYALCGLFAIDGSDDLDKVNDTPKTDNTPKVDDCASADAIGDNHAGGKQEKIDNIIREVNECDTKGKLLVLFNRLKGWTNDAQVKQAFTKRRQEIEASQVDDGDKPF